MSQYTPQRVPSRSPPRPITSLERWGYMSGSIPHLLVGSGPANQSGHILHHPPVKKSAPFPQHWSGEPYLHLGSGLTSIFYLWAKPALSTLHPTPEKGWGPEGVTVASCHRAVCWQKQRSCHTPPRRWGTHSADQNLLLLLPLANICENLSHAWGNSDSRSSTAQRFT